jgi:hypothetical protein
MGNGKAASAAFLFAWRVSLLFDSNLHKPQIRQ